jgi:hypothetical protein
MEISPLAAAHPREKTPARVYSTAETGNLRVTPGKSWAMVLQRMCAGGHFTGADFCGGAAPGASLRNRCYEPAVRQPAVPIPG